MSCGYSHRIIPARIHSSTRYLSQLAGLNEAILCAEIKQHKQGVPISRDLAHCMVFECEKTGELGLGRRVQFLMQHSGLDIISSLVNHLIRLFASSGSLIEGNQTFLRVSQPDKYTWNAIIKGHANLGKAELALVLYGNMQLQGTKIDKFTYLALMKAIVRVVAIEYCAFIHDCILGTELLFDCIVGNTLLNMYAKCGRLEEAQNVLNMLRNRNVVSWNAMINGYVQHGNGCLALQCFKSMQLEGTNPDKVTFLLILKACSILGCLHHGVLMHEHIIENGIEPDVVMGTTLLDMYTKCGNLDAACKMFERLPNKNVVSWNGMLAGYAMYNEGHLALECFKDLQREGLTPDRVTFLAILKACSGVNALEHGRHVHECIIEKDLHSEVVASALVDMYAKCWSLDEACKVFDRLPNRDVVSWGAMIEGCAQNGEGELALTSFDNMQSDDIKPSKVTFLSILKGCACVGAIQQGRHIHGQIIENLLQFDLIVSSALIDMYVKCGNLEEARRVFDMLPRRNIVSWGAMIAGYAQLGKAGLAMSFFEEMRSCGIQPNDITFSSILTSFSHVGLVEEALWYINATRELGIKPNIYHVTCMVDLLGRAGYLTDAEEFLKFTMQADACVWMTLLNACKMHYNVEIAGRCFNAIVQLDPSYSPAYVTMSNICAGPELYHVELLQRSRSLWKKHGSIESNKKLYEFVNGHPNHSKSVVNAH